MSCLLLLLFALGSGTACDLDGDGRVDAVLVNAQDADRDGCIDQPGLRPATRAQAAGTDSLAFDRVWTSDSILNNQWDACCGYLDQDTLLDILGHHWNPNELHVFESDGSGGYREVWHQTSAQPPASYVSVTAGDPDDDGRTEILGGECSTLGEVVLFENLGDNTWGEPYVLHAAPNERIVTVRVADTDRNDTNEVIVATGDVSGGAVRIFEHDGPPGVQSYSLKYEYTTVSYIYQIEIGDADNDGYPEILLGLGGWGGYPMNIRRIVYDPVTRTYSHHMFQSSIIGLPTSPLACDVNSTGRNELVVGGSGDNAGQIYVFKYAGSDSFEPRWTSNFTAPGNIIATHSARFADYPYPLIFGAAFSGTAYGITADDTGFHTEEVITPGTGAAIRSIDAAHDGDDELILAESTPADYVSVYRRTAHQAVAEPGRVRSAKLALSPNPAQGSVSVSAPERLKSVSVYGATGRLVRRCTIGRTVLWNGCDDEGAQVSPGTYVVRAATLTGTTLSAILIRL